jgi:transposase
LIEGYSFERLTADKAYDADGFRHRLAHQGAEAVISPRANRKTLYDYDPHLYEERHLVECFINKIKHYRRIFAHFDKLADCYFGFLCFAGALIWLR